ncbi:GntR family transcriptional regulator [Dactylosporangium sucinum]|uniref:GntR family transcriptional regulator n=1 Tax=Dactylosporangium sucinum TaxID=1424081 RepID=A0A917TLJ9_9ACTN|nr:GntR family transcriptional regulator [Dactylosporangium sucinum]GGM26845.1 GntR family transcriptional regulator [Dactylosporangium sucinum]
MNRDSASTQYERLRGEIVAGRIAPGTVLLETVLAERLGVSRTPVREALAMLERDGLLERDRRGYRVRTRSPEELLEIYEARIALESTCAAAAAGRRSAFDLARLRHLTGEAAAAGDPVRLRELHAAWHKALRAAAGNATIIDLLERLDTLLAVYDADEPTLTDRETAAAEHGRIVDAIEAGDAEEARRALVAHLDRSREARLAKLAAGS